MLGVAGLLIFVAVFLLVLALFSHGWRVQRSPRDLALKRLTTTGEQKTAVRVLRDDTMSAVPVLHRWLSSAPLVGTLKRYLEQAEISQRVGMILGTVLLLAILGGRVVWSLTSSWFWPALAVGVFGSLPFLYVRRRRRIRLSLYAEQLPDALDVLAQSLKVGHSLLQGIQEVAREMPDPTRVEFRRTYEELRLGRSLREALQSHASRVANLEFNLVATALLIQREVGGNLTEILETASRTIRERYKLLGQIRALSAQNRLAGRIIGALPFAIATMVYLLKPDLIMILFTDEVGKRLLALAVGMQILGFYVMKRIVTIKI